MFVFGGWCFVFLFWVFLVIVGYSIGIWIFVEFDGIVFKKILIFIKYFIKRVYKVLII